MLKYVKSLFCALAAIYTAVYRAGGAGGAGVPSSVRHIRTEILTDELRAGRVLQLSALHCRFYENGFVACESEQTFGGAAQITSKHCSALEHCFAFHKDRIDLASSPRRLQGNDRPLGDLQKLPSERNSRWVSKQGGQGRVCRGKRRSLRRFSAGDFELRPGTKQPQHVIKKVTSQQTPAPIIRSRALHRSRARGISSPVELARANYTLIGLRKHQRRRAETPPTSKGDLGQPPGAAAAAGALTSRVNSNAP
ncbi:hypothetical protein EVAR_61191_1 [Eumeta japonica]|uniref:Uncharacterized protein n=1 Tax=Eumeta variegata TaxID=151549 RepID=A0A4C1YWS1_EUMVA|nr:hypothetical protein EVAR_61191_1 [Eumeta japonica]